MDSNCHASLRSIANRLSDCGYLENAAVEGGAYRLDRFTARHPISVLTVQSRQAKVTGLIGDFLPFWRDGRVVEGGGLENRCSVCAEPWVRILLPPPE